MTIRHLFVYGTLQPGDVRWPFLAPFAADDGVADTVPGLLFDTGLGYPAAVFDGRFGSGDLSVMGRTYELRTDRLEAALAVLDEEESSVVGLYHRVEVTTDRGVAAWAYEYGDGLDLTPIADGDWLNRPSAPNLSGS